MTQVKANDKTPPPANNRGHIVATYDYCDERGVRLHQTVRYEPKDFRQRRSDGEGKWAWNLDGVRRVLYRLPELLAAPRDQMVFIVEGEKDVDNLHALGLVATCNVGGAGKWRDDYSEILRNRHVTIVPDNDDAGRKHAEAVARSVHEVAASVYTLWLPNLPDKGDVSDWLDNGGTAEILLELAAEAEPWIPSRPQDTTAAPAKEKRAAAEPVVCRLADVEPEDVSWLWENRIARKAVTIIDGDPGVLKSTITVDLTARVSRGWAMPPGGGADLSAVAG